MQLKNLVVDLGEIIKNPELIHAHTKDGCKSENLQEHTDRTVKYFHFIYKNKNLEKVFIRIRKILLIESPNTNPMLFEQLLINTISFHDIGKINPEFQRIVMGQKDFMSGKHKKTGDTRHSALSATIYMDYFHAVIEQAEIRDSEKKTLHCIMLMNAYVISRHHGGLREFSDFCDDFSENGVMCNYFTELKDELSELYRGPFLKSENDFAKLRNKNQKRMKKYLTQGDEGEQKKRKLTMYTYVRLLYSLLVSSDYYATTEYINDFKIQHVGNIHDAKKMIKEYEETERTKKIRKFIADKSVITGTTSNINTLRNCMFQEAEKKLLENRDKNIFFLEAPTGSGKSNVALNCSFQLLGEEVKKIFYVYPFNTLVEQNRIELEKIFGHSDILNDITVINSITPMKGEKRQNIELENREDSENFYQKILLDRQFLNYPFVLTTHVNLFQIMFGSEKEAAISFYQLAGSVVVLDEIQSYKNTIWTEIMLFLEIFSELLQMKVIIMSATLPRLDFLTGNTNQVVNLIDNREKYFENTIFKDRVKISYELLENKAGIEELFSHIRNQVLNNVKILVEFIKKSTAEAFYMRLKQYENDYMEVLCMTGDDNQIDREKILNKISTYSNKKSIVLIATQVIEAGVDIDMDIGYKDISKLDSDEQFLGRINRNNRRNGIVYFFNIDSAKSIYGKDFRIEKKYTLENPEMREVLKKKSFQYYYEEILINLKERLTKLLNGDGLEEFVNKEVGRLDFPNISKRMQLIEEDQWDMSVFIARTIDIKEQEKIDGREIWKQYKDLLQDNSIEYSKKMYLLSQIKSKLTLFIYKINKNISLNYNDRIGELYYLENGEQYFAEGRLDKNLLQNNGTLFIDL